MNLRGNRLMTEFNEARLDQVGRLAASLWHAAFAEHSPGSCLDGCE